MIVAQRPSPPPATLRRVTARRLLIRQALLAVVVGFVIYLSRGITAGIGYGIAFYAISTPLAIWASAARPATPPPTRVRRRRRCRPGLERLWFELGGVPLHTRG